VNYRVACGGNRYQCVGEKCFIFEAEVVLQRWDEMEHFWKRTRAASELAAESTLLAALGISKGPAMAK